jgi:hypothetical protein
MMGVVRIGNLGGGDVLPGNPRVREVEWQQSQSHRLRTDEI